MHRKQKTPPKRGSKLVARENPNRAPNIMILNNVIDSNFKPYIQTYS